MNNTFENLIDYIEEKKHHIITLGVMIVFLVGIADYRTGYEFGFSFFYLIPIFIVTWSARIFAGIMVSILSAVLWTGAHYFSGLKYSSAYIPFWNIGIRIMFFLIVVLTVDQLRKALIRERHYAQHDSLTGVANAMYFRERAKLEIQRSRRYKRFLSFAYIDCDNFKLVNDTMGHTKGDQLLRAIATLLNENIRSIDLVGRIGGDEFVIMLPETELEDVEILAPRLQKSLTEAMKEKGFSVTFSIGVAVFESMLNTVDGMLQRADELMYEAKKSGKNTIRYKTFKGIS